MFLHLSHLSSTVPAKVSGVRSCVVALLVPMLALRAATLGCVLAYQLVRPSCYAKLHCVELWCMFGVCRGVEPRSACACPRHGRGSPCEFRALGNPNQLRVTWICVWNECRSGKCGLQAVGL